MDETTKITYTVRENYLSQSDNNQPRYYAHVIRSANAVGRNYIVNEMADRNTTVSRQDIIVVLDLFREMVMKLLRKGYNIKTDLFNAYVSIKGSFQNEKESFSKQKHHIKINMSPDNSLVKDVETLAEFRKLDKKPEKPELKKIYDFATKTSNTIITPGRLAQLTGKNLFMDQSNPDHGIWFIQTGTDIKVKADNIDRNTQGNILFTVPENLEADTDYKVGFHGGLSSFVREANLDGVIRTSGQAPGA